MPVRTRSLETITQSALPQPQSGGLSSVPKATPHTGRISPTKSLITLDDNEQMDVIRRLCLSAYKVEARELQVKPVLSLCRFRDAFLIASTGFGKSLIPELFYLIFPKSSKPIILTLNPLDALGNNQVEEKKKHGLSAINLTGATFTKQAYHHILTGKYQFIYVSPEIFLNNLLFEKLYFSKWFQEHLILKVVDEAHLIYHWGLVESGKMKHLHSHNIHQDRTAFRPSYGNLIERFLATESIPTLLMSATCPPQHLEQILSSLKITRESIDIHVSELTRPEIRFIRVTLPRTHKPWNTLKKLFAPKNVVSDTELVPSLIYCHTQNDTYTALATINSARQNEDETENGLSSSVRRYHADTDSIDKVRNAQDFMDEKFNIMTCTNALGLGQNWKRVRQVIILGQLDPMEVIQMAGRGGRDRRPAVAILLVQPLAAEDEKSLLDLSDPIEQDDDQRMNAMVLTKVCLRVAFSILLRCGYVPLSKECQSVVMETQRQRDAGMTSCICSNCNPKAADFFMAQQPCLTQSNFTDIILEDDPPESYTSLDEQANFWHEDELSPDTQIRPSIPRDPLRTDLRLIRLRLKIERSLKALFDIEYPEGAFYTVDDLCSPEMIWLACVNYDLCLEGLDLDFIFGSEPLPKVYEVIMREIRAWRANKRDFFAILDPSEDEFNIYNQAKVALAELDKATQQAKEMRATQAKQARQDQQQVTPSAPKVNTRKPPVKVVRPGKKARTQSKDINHISSVLSSL